MRLRAISDNFVTWVRPSIAIGAIVPSARNRDPEAGTAIDKISEFAPGLGVPGRARHSKNHCSRAVGATSLRGWDWPTRRISRKDFWANCLAGLTRPVFAWVTECSIARSRAYDFSVIGDAPYGAFYSSIVAPSFDAPFQNRGTGTLNTNPFPANFNPPSNIPATVFGTFGTSPAFNPSNRVPYAEQYEVSVQRQLRPADLLTLSYVGTQGHHLLVTQEANPVIHSLCVADPACVPGDEPSYDRGPFSSHDPTDIANGLNQFASEGYFSAIGNSAYPSFQIDFRHNSGPLQLLLGYTYSKSLDDASGFGSISTPPASPQRRLGNSGQPGAGSSQDRASIISTWRWRRTHALARDTIWSSAWNSSTS